jgi:acetylornithine deacetylase/succinyl-diaminopimelate desuccinylase-like protein
MSLVEDLVAIASVPAPTFAEEARVEWLEERLRGLPGRRRRDEVGNLIWEWGEGRPRVLLAAHLDTVFAAETPLEFERDGDYLVGPGVGDNAAAVAVAIEVVSGLLEEAAPAPGAVAFTVGEEGLGNLRGAAHACRELRPEVFVALEGHMLESAVVDAVGSVRARIAVSAPGGHSWSDRGGPSAIHELVGIAGALLKLGTPEAPVNVGTISGGRSVNALADRAELLVECRSIEQAPLDRFEAALGGLAVGDGCELEIEPLGRRPGGSLGRDTELFAAIGAVRSQLGLELTLAAASTDANAAHALGVPALCIGVSRGSGMHSLSERIDLTTLPLGVAQLRELLLRLPAVSSKSTAAARQS